MCTYIFSYLNQTDYFMSGWNLIHFLSIILLNVLIYLFFSIIYSIYSSYIRMYILYTFFYVKRHMNYERLNQTGACKFYIYFKELTRGRMELIRTKGLVHAWGAESAPSMVPFTSFLFRGSCGPLSTPGRIWVAGSERWVVSETLSPWSLDLTLTVGPWLLWTCFSLLSDGEGTCPRGLQDGRGVIAQRSWTLREWQAGQSVRCWWLQEWEWRVFSLRLATPPPTLLSVPPLTSWGTLHSASIYSGYGHQRVSVHPPLGHVAHLGWLAAKEQEVCPSWHWVLAQVLGLVLQGRGEDRAEGLPGVTLWVGLGVSFPFPIVSVYTPAPDLIRVFSLDPESRWFPSHPYSAHTEKEDCWSGSLYIRHIPEEVKCPVPRRTATPLQTFRNEQQWLTR